ncbi:hypothetical protein [Microbulbifer sp. VAAF005]|uniref:hypothetical protein n=1 Tax=Microbulbifer sp. VAAF005 TaxID=3034230 RepID=UPI0024AE47A7|nr:hypothetical protein [Microbulbifer sp. VAAF005]WHI48027.1 hypothetical protein P0078_06500 [Microbulbifer sp. VAAF005]
MTMRDYLILLCSIVLAGLGFLLPQDQLFMAVRQDGELFRPLSSGGDDPTLIKIALGSYIASAFFAIISLYVRKIRRFIFPLYLVNSGFYILLMAFVSIDSGVIIAAKHGNWLPVGQLILWLLFLLVIIWVSLKRSIQSNSKVSAN